MYGLALPRCRYEIVFNNSGQTAASMALYRHRLIFIYLKQIILSAVRLGELHQRCAAEIELVGLW
jgi:hypothetical protein